MLGATRLKFTLFPRARLELKLSPGMRFRHWDAGIVAGLFRSPEDPKLIGLDCAMFAVCPCPAEPGRRSGADLRTAHDGDVSDEGFATRRRCRHVVPTVASQHGVPTPHAVAFGRSEPPCSVALQRGLLNGAAWRGGPGGYGRSAQKTPIVGGRDRTCAALATTLLLPSTP